MLERDLEAVVDQPAIVFSSYASVVLSAVQAMAPDFVISFKNSRPEIQRLIQAVKVIEVDYEDFLQGKLPEGLESLLKMKLNKWIVFDAFVFATRRPVDLPKILQFAERYSVKTLLNDAFL